MDRKPYCYRKFAQMIRCSDDSVGFSVKEWRAVVWLLVILVDRKRAIVVYIRVAQTAKFRLHWRCKAPEGRAICLKLNEGGPRQKSSTPGAQLRAWPGSLSSVDSIPSTSQTVRRCMKNCCL